MAISNAPWDGSSSRWPDAKSFLKSCLIVRQHDGEPTKDDGSLPIKEPNGDINKNALGAAAAALAGARGGLKDVSASDKKKAARALIRAYGEAKMEPPPSLKSLAGA